MVGGEVSAVGMLRVRVRVRARGRVRVRVVRLTLSSSVPKILARCCAIFRRPGGTCGASGGYLGARTHTDEG